MKFSAVVERVGKGEGNQNPGLLFLDASRLQAEANFYLLLFSTVFMTWC